MAGVMRRKVLRLRGAGYGNECKKNLSRPRFFPQSRYLRTVMKMNAKMKKLLFGALLCAGLWGMSACSSKSQVEEFKDFVEEVCREGGTYTEKQWEEAEAKFTELLEKAENCKDLTQEDLYEIARLQGEYAAAAFKSQGKGAMEKAGAIMNGFMDGLMDEGEPGKE